MGQGLQVATDLDELQLPSFPLREKKSDIRDATNARLSQRTRSQACAHATWRGLQLRELGSDSCRQSHFTIDRKFGLCNKNASF